MIISFMYLPSRNKMVSKDLLEGINISPIRDSLFKGKSYHYEVGSLSYVLALLCKQKDPKKFASLDEGFLSAESCFGEEEACEVINCLDEASKILVPALVKKDKNYAAIAYFLNFLQASTKCEILCADESKIAKSDTFVLHPLDDYNGLLVFFADLGDESLYCSKQFATIAKLKDKDKCLVKTSTLEFETTLRVSEKLRGTIGVCKLANENFEKIRAIKCL